MIALKYCSIEWTDSGSLTKFFDNTEINSFPHNTPHYHVIAHRCGYGDDLLMYCREHDFFHCFFEQYFNNRASPVLWALAHDFEVEDSLYEEVIVQTCQRWVRTNERPIVGGVDWDDFKCQAITLLEKGATRALSSDG